MELFIVLSVLEWAGIADFGLESPTHSTVHSMKPDVPDQLTLIDRKLQSLLVNTAYSEGPLGPFEVVPDEVIVSVLSWMHPRSVFRYRRLNRRANELLQTKYFAVVFLSRLGRSVPRWDTATSQLESLFFLGPPSFQSVFAEKYLQSRHTIEWRVQLHIPSHIKTHNSFKASMPSALGELPNLRHLKLQNLKGPIPIEIGNLANLTLLSFEHCPVNGPIPAHLFNLTELTYLNLHDCGLTGTLSPEISRLEKLQHLYLSLNSLEGNIPPSIGSMSRLISLNLGLNRFSGSIPPELGGLTVLQDLCLASNKLTGKIPSEFRSLTALRSLSVKENLLEDVLP